jgi:hypothetical protein
VYFSIQLARQEAPDRGGFLYLYVTVIAAKSTSRMMVGSESFGLLLPINGSYPGVPVS